LKLTVIKKLRRERDNKLDEKLKVAWSQFNEARSGYESYLADPYTAGSDEDNDCMMDHLLELADKAIALFDQMKENQK
jgi:hypothetical protein